MSLLFDYPQLKVIQQLSQSKKVKVYLVGGFLRDDSLGQLTRSSVVRPGPVDFDFAEFHLHHGVTFYVGFVP